MGEPRYERTIQRILDILQNVEVDSETIQLNEKIAEFRFGEYPDEVAADKYPACYVTTARKPEISREGIGPSSELGVMPLQKIVTEYWIMLLANEATAEATQKMVYDLRDDVIRILSRNTQLRRRPENDKPLCHSIDIKSIGRTDQQRGKLLDGINVMIRTIDYKDSPDATYPIADPDDDDDSSV